MTATMQDIAVGDRIKLEDGIYEVYEIEKGQRTRRAEQGSVQYEAALKIRPLNRYMALTVEPYQQGEIVTEKWTCLRLRSRTKNWNVYVSFEVVKGELN